MDSDEAANPHRWIVLVGLITASILEVLDTTIVNVALPTIGGNLGATTEEVAWVSTGYILSNVIVLPMTAWLASVFGRRRYLTGSIILFTVSSFLCGTSSSLTQLIMWRIIQGGGGAALLSTAQATLREIFPAEQQGTVQSIFVLGVIMAPTLGPVVGGYITDDYSWRWIFFINVPIGAIAALLVSFFLRDTASQKGPVQVDLPGIFLLAVGLGCMQYVLEEGNRKDWFEDQRIILFTTVGVITLTLLIAWELWPGNKHPVINLRVLKNRDLSAALVLYLALGFGLYGGTFIFPLFAQTILGFTPTATGLALMPGGIATGVSAIVCGQILNRPRPIVGPRVLVVTGIGLFLCSMWDLGHMTTVAGEPEARVALIFRGAGLGMLFTPLNLAALSSLKRAEIPQATSMLNLMRQLGGSLGIAALSTYITRRTITHYTDLATNAWAGNPEWESRSHAIAGGMTQAGINPGTVPETTLRLLSGIVREQALMLSFNDAFILIGLSMLMVSPLILVLRKHVIPRGGGGDMH